MFGRNLLFVANGVKGLFKNNVFSDKVFLRPPPPFFYPLKASTLFYSSLDLRRDTLLGIHKSPPILMFITKQINGRYMHSFFFFFVTHLHLFQIFAYRDKFSKNMRRRGAFLLPRVVRKKKRA